MRYIAITKGINEYVQVRYRIGLNVATGLRTNERSIFLFTVARLTLNKRTIAIFHDICP
jgi:hypothetical protein